MRPTTTARWPRTALAALLALTLGLLSGCVGEGGSDHANPVEGWTPEDGFVRNWDK